MPTVRGRLVAGAGALLLVAGWWFGYREIALLGAVAVLAVLAAAVAVALQRPRRATVHRSLSVARTEPGSEAQVALMVDEVRSPGGLRLRERVSGADGERLLDLPPGPSRAVALADYQVVPSRRGVLTLGPLRIERTDPFGLAATGGAFGGESRLYVHPRWRVLRALPAVGASVPDGGLDRGRAGTLTYRSLREYVPGDDIRHVHWRSTARHDRMLVREFGDTSDTRLTVLVDDRADPGGPRRLDGPAEAAACVLATAIQHGLACELVLLSGARTDDRFGMAPILDTLATVAPGAHSGLQTALAAARSSTPGAAVVVVSAGLSQSDLVELAAAEGRGSGLVVAVIGSEARLTPVAGVALVAVPSVAEFDAAWNEAPWTR